MALSRLVRLSSRLPQQNKELKNARTKCLWAGFALSMGLGLAAAKTGVASGATDSPSTQGTGLYGVPYRDEMLSGIDLHLHPGSYDKLGPLGKAFILDRLPQFLPDFLKEFSLKVSSSLLQNPYGAFIGIKNQCLDAGLDLCGLFATYAPETWGVVTNADIKVWLKDKRNTNPHTNVPMFFGLASVDIRDWQNQKESRLHALEEDLGFTLFRGIKLAFIHNNVPLDDPQYDGIYEVAERTGMPVYHHVGSSPIRKLSDFPDAQSQKEYLRSYDPGGLERVIKAYPTVSFILGHMGFDFNKEGFSFDDEVFRLAENYSNVYLEISAFGGASYDTDGKYKDKIFARLKNENLLERTLYGSDGPGAPGGPKRYLRGVLSSFDRVGYTPAEVGKVLFDNTNRIFRLEEIKRQSH